ncbi:MarR family winged helix-turn-helix transcriptional regulator [Acetobacterium tundrae]|uniref:MarR family transcriptional regulator n=1 Tax=Acetobacterium tundrae TaxID=132932 RepID=A0ABR6WHV5_9FIRM|nr:MarR family transcriptional regulator [Acetobacterium tundrae]MBC3795868.1 MarR family transcriptional regulator [Acetobacterium tundrae]
MQQEEIMHLLKLNNKIFRTTQVYLDKVLKKYELSSGSYPYLLMLKHQDGINQNKISEKLGYDKAMTTRTVTKLIKLGYLERNKDETDHRANNIYLTEKANVVIENILDEIHQLIQLMTKGMDDEEKINTVKSLQKLLTNMRELNI